MVSATLPNTGSVTQDDVSLTVASPVRYHAFHDLCYEPWSLQCIK